MSSHALGKVFIHTIPTREAALQVFNALRTVHPELDKETLVAMMRKRPILLLDEVAGQDAEEVLDYLKSYGIRAVFTPDMPESSMVREQEASEESEAQAEQPAQPANAHEEFSFSTAKKTKKGLGWWIRQSVALGLIACGALFALWFFKPGLTISLFPFLPVNPRAPLAVPLASNNPAAIKEAPSVFREPQEPKLKTRPLPRITPVDQAAPGVLGVPAEQITAAFELRYRLRPDVRFIKALRFLTRIEADEKQRCAMGTMVWSKDELTIPLMKNGQKADELRVPLPLTFPGMLDGLKHWIGLLKKQGYSFALSSAPVIALPLQSALNDLSEVDQRAVLNGLAGLDQLWRKGGPNQSLLGPALLANVLLATTLRPDPLRRTDAVAAEALGLLAIERHDKPDAENRADTFIVARLLGYDAYAQTLQVAAVSQNTSSLKKLLLSYFQKDRETLQKMHAKAPSPLSSYLLARLCLASGDDETAFELLQTPAKKNPYEFPWLSEGFYVNSLSNSKQTSVRYPLLLLHQVARPGENSQAKETAMELYAKALLGNEPVVPAKGSLDGDISFEAFDKLLSQWQPFTESEASGFLMDNDRARAVMRCLYEGAMEQRFVLLFKNWNVLEAARVFSQNLLGRYKINKLAKLYLARTLTNMGQSKQANKYAAENFYNRKTKGDVAFKSYQILQRERQNAELTGMLADRLDSRPSDRCLLGLAFQNGKNPVLAAAYYEQGIKGCGEDVWLLKKLERLTKSRDALLAYAEKHQNDCEVQSKIGKYFVDKKTTQGFAAALPYFTRALALRPDDPYLTMMKAWCLRELGRGTEAISILKDAISLYPKRDLRYIQLLCVLTKNYLKLKNGPLAVETIRSAVDSYTNDALVTGAKAYELNGDTADARKYFLKAAERYPDSDYAQTNLAAFYWRHGEYGPAAEVIKKGSASGAFFYKWYYDSFSESFTDQPPEQGLEAYKLFAVPGRPDWEAETLAEQLDADGLHQLAFDIAGLRIPANPHSAAKRYILLNTIGPKLPNPPDTTTPLRNLVKVDYRKDRLQNMLMEAGKYAMVLDIYKNAAEFDTNVRHAVMLNNLICWLRLDRQPPEQEQAFVNFFKQDRKSFLMLAGRFLLGLISRKELLQAADTMNTRSMACYFVGLKERLRGNFTEAATWYQICRETNGKVYERLWITPEMRRWQAAGLNNLQKMDTADALSKNAAAGS